MTDLTPEEKVASSAREILKEFGYREDAKFSIEADLWLFNRIKADLLTAKKEAYEDCARIAESYHFSRRGNNPGIIACMPGVCYCSDEKIRAKELIAADIRAKLKEGA